MLMCLALWLWDFGKWELEKEAATYDNREGCEGRHGGLLWEGRYYLVKDTAPAAAGWVRSPMARLGS